jgi:hypothetical protein
MDDKLAWSGSIDPEDAPEGTRGWAAAEKGKAVGTPLVQVRAPVIEATTKNGSGCVHEQNGLLANN